MDKISTGNQPSNPRSSTTSRDDEHEQILSMKSFEHDDELCTSNDNQKDSFNLRNSSVVGLTCEEKLIDLKRVLEQSQLPDSSTNELTLFIKHFVNARIQLENRMPPPADEFNEMNLDRFISEIDALLLETHREDCQTTFIEERCQQRRHIQGFIHRWTSFLSMNTADQHSSTSINEQAQSFLNEHIQLGNRKQLEQLTNLIQNFLQDQSAAQLVDSVRRALANRQLLLRRMLINSAQIDRLRVNLVSQFHSENDANQAKNQIQAIINDYPSEMTTQIRQWYSEQPKISFSTPERTKTIVENIHEYLEIFEEKLHNYSQITPTQWKHYVEQLNRLPENLSTIDQQRVLRLKKQLEDLRKPVNNIVKTPMQISIETMDQLIQRVRDYEEQFQKNLKHQNSDYENSLVDCRRIIRELEENLHVQVENAIENGKKFYAPDSRENSALESADETTAGSPSSSPILKKRADLTIRKVRRHVLLLAQHWKTIQTNVRHRLNSLERLQTAVEDLRRKCEQVHAHLLETELIYAHRPQIRGLNLEQVPIEIEQAKSLLSSLMSEKNFIEDIQQCAQTMETQFDLRVACRAEELEQRWNHSINAITQRIQSLQETIKNSNADIYSVSVEPPWQRTSSTNQRPYYINHADQTTSWDHPKMLELMRSFSNFNDVRFAAYRTAMKLRALQKRLCLDLTLLTDIQHVFSQHRVEDSIHQFVDIPTIIQYLHQIFERTAQSYPQLIHVILTVDLTLNWLLNTYDLNQTGSIRLVAMQTALALLCRGNIEDKYRYIFSLVACSNHQRQLADRTRLALLFQHVIIIPKQLGEVAAFGGSSVEPSVQSCLEYASNQNAVGTEEFLEWVKLEPQSIVWLPVMHRLAASETAKHEARCNICKVYPILGFRYRSLRFFNCDICQTCFFSGKQTKLFKIDHPLQEYYTETSSTEDVRDFFRIFKNKFRSKTSKPPKLGYLPLPLVFDSNASSVSISSPSPSPVHMQVSSKVETNTTTAPQTNVFSSSKSDEHGIIARHCRDLNSLTNSQTHPMSVSIGTLDREQQQELEAIIRDLEDENRLLQFEYDRLCQEHFEKSRLIDEQPDSTSALQTLDSQLDTRRRAKQLRQYQGKLEQRMKVLEQHNSQLEKQLQWSKQLLTDHRANERQPNLSTIDNLFHMADDINRAVGDLVSVITEPQPLIRS